MSEWRKTAEWDWVQLLDVEDRSVLHCVKDVINDPDKEWYGEGTTMCGIQGDMNIPGPFTRMSDDTVRCERCCEITGMPQGTQSPCNREECRPVVLGRLWELGINDQRDS